MAAGMNTRNMVEVLVVSATWMILAVLAVRIRSLISDMDGFDTLEEVDAGEIIPLPDSESS